MSVYADDLKWLEQQTLGEALGWLPRHIKCWLASFVQDTPLQDWEPFHANVTRSAAKQLQAWEKHAGVELPVCLGVRSVADLGHVDANLGVTQTRPVELAKLRWALSGYQAQLQREKRGEAAAHRAAAAAQAEFRRQAVLEERATAKYTVQGVYQQCKLVHDVHSFVRQLRMHHPRLDADKLGDKPSSNNDSPEWKSSMRIIIGNAIKMVHPDKAAAGTTPKEEAHALEMFDVLLKWKTIYA